MLLKFLFAVYFILKALFRTLSSLLIMNKKILFHTAFNRSTRGCVYSFNVNNFIFHVVQCEIHFRLLGGWDVYCLGTWIKNYNFHENSQQVFSLFVSYLFVWNVYIPLFSSFSSPSFSCWLSYSFNNDNYKVAFWVK